jgi:hypothetical protein
VAKSESESSLEPERPLGVSRAPSRATTSWCVGAGCGALIGGRRRGLDGAARAFLALARVMQAGSVRSVVERRGEGGGLSASRRRSADTAAAGLERTCTVADLRLAACLA